MQENYKLDLEIMMERYMSKLSFLEKEILSLSLSVSYLRNIAYEKELNTSLPVLVEHEHEDYQVQLEDEIEETLELKEESEVYQYENQTMQSDPESIIQEVEEVESQEDEFNYETEIEMLYESPANTHIVSSKESPVKNKRHRKISDIQEESQEPKLMKCISMINLLPLNNENDLLMLDEYLLSNTEETSKFVAYLKKNKFDKGLKSAFFNLITHNLLLEFNYNGKGQMKRALNKYTIFNRLIFGQYKI